jgi:hypothetical protein
MYKLTKNLYTNTVNGVKKNDGDYVISIPFAPDNTEYQKYLAWVAEGNTPEPADE